MTVLTADVAPGDLARPAGWMGRARRGAVLLIAAGGDAVNFYGALAIADPNLYGWQVVAAVLALTSATVGLMHFAGVSASKRRLSGDTLRSWSGAVLTLLWLAMGASAFLIRLAGEPDEAALALPGATPAAATGVSLAHLGLALLMFALFLGTGGMAAWAAYNGHDPEHDRHVALRRARRWIRFRAARATRVQRRQERWRRRRAGLATAVQRLVKTCAAGLRRWAVRGADVIARAVRERRRHAAAQRAERREADSRRDAERTAALAQDEAERSALLATQARERMLQALEDRERLAHEALTSAVARHDEVVDLAQRRQTDAVRDEERHLAAQRTVRPWADELRDYARLRLATALSDPATTTTLTAPQLPRPTLHREDVS